MGPIGSRYGADIERDIELRFRCVLTVSNERNSWVVPLSDCKKHARQKRADVSSIQKPCNPQVPMIVPTPALY